MNAKSTYKTPNGVVTYGYMGSKWQFQVGPKFSYLTKCPGGRFTADAVAMAICGSFARTHSEAEPIDGLGRWTIRQATSAKPVEKD